MNFHMIEKLSVSSSLMKNHFQNDSDVPLAVVIQQHNPDLNIYGYKKYDKAECIIVPMISIDDTSKVDA